MNLIRASLVGAVVAAAFATPAFATTHTTPLPSCANPSNAWFVNTPDESDRAPARKPGGFEFSGNDLIHHATSVALKDLKPGAYWATPAPDQPSFFSVEVRDATTGGYGTLRWDKGAGKWNITLGTGTAPGGTPATAGTFQDSNPVTLLTGKVSKFGAFTNATKAVTFGVGYTNSPPGTVTTLVSAVKFQGKIYKLGCMPRVVVPPTKPTVHPTKPTPNTNPCTAYVYKGTKTNLCHDFPGPRDRDCGTGPGEVAHPVTVVAVLDVWHLDRNWRDKDRTGCEGLPPYTPPTTTPTTPATTPTATTPVGHVGGSDSGNPSLPVTGPAGAALVALGATALIGGVAALAIGVRRRRTRFEA